MSNPTRYSLSDPNEDSCGPTAKMEVDAHGDYVKWEDVEALQDELAALRKLCDPQGEP